MSRVHLAVLTIATTLAAAAGPAAAGPEQWQQTMAPLIVKIQKTFLDDAMFTMFGSRVVPEAKVVPDTVADAIPWFHDGPGEESVVGLEVTDLLDQKLSSDPDARMFVVGHEFGHALSEAVLDRLDKFTHQPQPRDGLIPEVVADLGAVYLMNLSGVSWDDIIKVVDDWQDNWVFAMNQMGQHPPGSRRAELCKLFIKLARNPQVKWEAAMAVTLQRVSH